MVLEAGLAATDGETDARVRIDARRRKARLVIAAERELRELKVLPTREYASADDLIAAAAARVRAPFPRTRSAGTEATCAPATECARRR
jgi:hypothetical protein